MTNLEEGSSSDHLVEQLMPVAMWGRQFIATPLPYGPKGNTYTRSAQYISHYVVVAADSDTSVKMEYYQPKNGSLINEEVENLNRGEKYSFAKKQGSLLVITASKAIQVLLFKTIAYWK